MASAPPHRSTNPRVTCQCGAVSFTASAPEPSAVYICHCLECQRQSSSAFGVSAVFPLEGMLPLPENLQSQVQKWTRLTDAGNTLECYFCKTCGVRLVHRSLYPDGSSKPTVTVKGGCLEDLNLKNPIHIYTRSARVPVPEDGIPGSPGGD